MSQIAAPPNPSLLAIILIVQSKDGSRFAFHYPPDPLTIPAPASQQHNHGGSISVENDYSSDSEEGTDSASDGEKQSTVRGRSKNRTLNSEAGSLSSGIRKARTTDEEEGDSSNSDSPNQGAAWTAPWDSFLSLSTTSLEKLLSPSTRTWHKRRFEVGINELCFVGWPVFVRDDGTWQKRKKRSKARHDEMASSGASFGQEPSDQHLPVTQNEESLPDISGARPGASSNDSQPRSSSSPESAHTDMLTMFNVVFVMNPPVLEYSLRVREMYNNVTKKLGKALKWEQARVDYVWKEAQTILHLKEKARENRTSMSTLYSEILSKSSLARAIASVFSSISTNRIATATFTSEVSISLQIQPASATRILPSATDPPTQPGLWLTTADSVSDDLSTQTGSSVQLAKHFALLLLDNESSILKDVDAEDGRLANALSHYIRCSTPTKSFAQISTMHDISLADIQLLARHLVYWRRARPIPPLHQRDTYIVSPNADMSKLEMASRLYEATFPTLPSLPKMLGALSGTPRPFNSLIPTKDHKQTYFLILAWLLRGGWVTQLRTFARIKIGPDVKEWARYFTAEQALEMTAQSHNNSLHREPAHSELTNIRDRSLSDTPYISHQLKDDVESSERNLGPSLILYPQRASPLESRWIDQIQKDLAKLSRRQPNLSENEVKELQEHWPIFNKFFNGADALEKIPVREGLKRKKVWNMLGKLGVFERGVGDDGNGKILVTVRHW